MDAMDARLMDLCRRLKLPSVYKQARARADEAVRQGTHPLDFLAGLLEAELDVRDERRAQRRVKEAGFPLVKTLEGFDFRRNASLPEALIRQLAHGDYIRAAEPVVLYGESGTGKTHLSTALGVAAARQGHAVRFTTAAALATELTEAKDARELARVVGRYSRVDLLIIDELGYLPLSVSDAELLFRVLGERQERRPIVVTTNLPFSEWTTVFPDPRLCRAVVDRLTHRAHIIDTGSHSVRLSETLARMGRPTPPTPPPPVTP